MSKPPVCYSPLLYKGISDQTPLWRFAVTDPVEPSFTAEAGNKIFSIKIKINLK